MWWPEMAQTWPSGPSSASDIDFGANFTKATVKMGESSGLHRRRILLMESSNPISLTIYP